MERRNTEAQRLRGTETKVLNGERQGGKSAKILWWAMRLGLTVVLVGVALVIVPRVRGFTLSDAEAFIGAALPDGAADVQFATREQFARVVWLRFTLPPDADVTVFVEALGLVNELRDGFTPFPAQNYTEAEFVWWTPHTAQAVSGLHTVHASKVYEVLLDRTDAAALTVYLRVYAL